MKRVLLLCINLPEINGYVKSFSKTKFMPFLIKDGQFLKK